MRRLIGIILFAILSLSGSQSIAATGDAASDPAIPIEALVGDTVTIRLAANPTTGYRWGLAAEPDPGVLAYATTEYVATQPGLIGSGGTEIWTFKAVGAGTTTVNLAYARPWERDLPVAEKRTFTVIVRNRQ